jgi:hypothetical protein
MKVGDLVRFDPPGTMPAYRATRRTGIIVGFDEDGDPKVIWSHPSFRNYAEPNYRAHLVMLSEM